MTTLIHALTRLYKRFIAARAKQAEVDFHRHKYLL